MPTPEDLARVNIDKLLTSCGWAIQDMSELNRYAGLGVAVREFPLQTGEADYLLFVDGKAMGVIEAKPEGTTLSGVAEQAASYVVGLPANIPHVTLPLPFQYESTGVETLFRDNRDRSPRSRRTFAFYRPEQLNEWINDTKGTFHARLQDLPPLNEGKMWSAQIEAVTSLEASLAQDKPRSLIQMATGSGKTFTAINAIYRIIKFGGARRVLFLVDRGNLGDQTLKEFQQYVSPYNNFKFTEEFIVQRLAGNTLDTTARVCIS